MKAFLHSKKLLISASITMGILLTGCGGGGGSTETNNTATISSVSIGQENGLSSATSSENTHSEAESSTSNVSHSDDQNTSSLVSSVASSITSTSTHSSSQNNSSIITSNSVASEISSIENSISSSSKSSAARSSNTPTSPLSSSNSSQASTAISSTSKNEIASSSRIASSSVYSSSLNQISSSSIIFRVSSLSSSSSLPTITSVSSSSSSTTGTIFHLRGTHNAWIEGDLFTQVAGSTTDFEICRNFPAVTGGANFKVDPNGGWGGDEFPAISVTASGWTKIVIDGVARTIQSTSKDMTTNCEADSSSSFASSSSSSQSITPVSSSSAASSLASFSFSSIYDAPTLTEIVSEEIKISGLDGVGFISITGGQFSIDNQAFQKNTSKIYNNQTLIIKVKTTALGSTSTQAILTLSDIRGSRTTSFTVTTAVDLIPDMFSFTPVINSQLNVQNYSNYIIVKGIDRSVPISISGSGASYSIPPHNIPLTEPSTIKNGESVYISLMSADKVGTTTSATLTIGNMSQTFTVTTVPETSAPIAKFIFPSSISMTDKNSIQVRGQSSDMNKVTSVKVNGVEVTTTDNYANWKLNISLEKGENTITVSTKDNLNNYLQNAATIKVISGEGHTPNDKNLFDGPKSIALDILHNRLIVGDHRVSPRPPASDPEPALYFVDLASGARTPLPTPYNWFADASDIAIDTAHNRALIVDESTGYVIARRLEDGSTSPFHEFNISPGLSAPCCIVIDAIRDRAIVATHVYSTLRALKLSTGAMSTLSSNSAPNSDYKFYTPQGMVIDEKNDRVLVVDSNGLTGLVTAVDLTTGVRTNIPINSPQSTGHVDNPQFIALDEKRNRLLISEMNGGQLNSVDLNTGTTTRVDNINNSNKVVIDQEKDLAYIASYWKKSIILVDLITSETVTLSR